MKKSFLYACLVFSLFMFTGCNRVTLKCEKEINEGIFKDGKQKISVVFKDDVAYKLDYYADYTFTDESLREDSELVDKIAPTVSSEWDDITGKDGVYYSISKNATGLVAKLKINFNKLTSDEKKNVHVINYKGSYSMIKRDLENNGYLCK